MKKLGLPSDKVNPLGGAIALGHPLGQYPLPATLQGADVSFIHLCAFPPRSLAPVRLASLPLLANCAGCTGARQIVTLVHYLKERAKAAGGAKQVRVSCAHVARCRGLIVCVHVVVCAYVCVVVCARVRGVSMSESLVHGLPRGSSHGLAPM